MEISVIGATGATGRAVVARARQEGHRVRVLARTADAFPRSADLEVVVGTIEDQDAVSRGIAGADAVISSLGTNSKTVLDLCERGAVSLLKSLPPKGRLVVVSAYGAGSSNDRSLYSRLTRGALGPKMVDKDRMEAIIHASDADWTIVRPSFLRNGPGRGRYRVGADVRMTPFSRIDRVDLALYLVSCATTERDSGLAVGITA